MLPLPVSFLGNLALVMRLAALGKHDLKFGHAPVVEVEAVRHNGHAVAIDRIDEIRHLLAVQQQFSPAARIVVEAIGLKIFRYV